jgi:hypothetical protein
MLERRASMRQIKRAKPATMGCVLEAQEEKSMDGRSEQTLIKIITRTLKIPLKPPGGAETVYNRKCPAR